MEEFKVDSALNNLIVEYGKRVVELAQMSAENLPAYCGKCEELVKANADILSYVYMTYKPREQHAHRN